MSAFYPQGQGGIDRRMPINKGWRRLLTRPIYLRGAPVDRLVSLKDASELLAELVPAPEVEEAAHLLIRAAETGDADVIATATNGLIALLRARGWWLAKKPYPPRR